MKKIKICVAVCTSVMCLSANALSSMQPGLWEVTSVMKSQSGNFEKMMEGLQANLAKTMSPEEKKIMAESMAESGTKINGANSVTKDCVTKEQAAKMEIPKFNEDCKQQVVKLTDNEVKLKFACTGKFPATGEGDFKLSNPKAYVMTSVVNTSITGSPDKITVNTNGKWLSDNCGKIQPRQN